MIDYFLIEKHNFLSKIRENVAYKARRKMFDRFLKMFCPSVRDQVLDLGVTPDTKLKDSNYFEKWYPHKENLTIASIEDCNFLVDQYGLKCFVKNKPGKRLPFQDQEFDILFCSAVLEHVGSRKEQEYFLSECFRISKRAFITTPYRYFPIETHTYIPFIHWLPWSLFQSVVRAVYGKDAFLASTDNLNLLCERDVRRMAFRGGISIGYIRTFGFKSNMLIIFDEKDRT